MAFDMMPLKLAFKMIAASERAIEETRKGLERSKEMLNFEKNILIELIQPLFMTSIEAVNMGLHYKIALEGILFVLDIPSLQIKLDVTLKADGGEEPDECIEEAYVEKLNTLLALRVNPLLKEEGVPFQFVGIILPPEYYRV